jgi:hypothetical protein
VQEAACPVIVLIHARDPEFVKEASKRGVFAHISDADVEGWQSSIDIVLRRRVAYCFRDIRGSVKTDPCTRKELTATPATTPNRSERDRSWVILVFHLNPLRGASHDVQAVTLRLPLSMQRSSEVGVSLWHPLRLGYGSRMKIAWGLSCDHRV